ncbi:P-loop containing nucleoside triphosphate hydrolase protein [Infundibulicybe gibba]|nr:P-loop containing nucleoside triphosphate hydrolase protein [Infundibulicybe gibba]
MPPRKGIVKSGNAGNSSKAIKASDPEPPTSISEKPLFPPGSKYPLSLLHERCQKLGWEKPVVDAWKRDDGWAFAVRLSKLNKKTSQIETIRLEPHPPYLRPTALEARHWGATYALHRFCNGIQLNRVLPPGPREYWNELDEERKKVPDSMKWVYDADPFVAKQHEDARRAKVTQKREAKDVAGSSSSHRAEKPGDSSRYPEVMMATSLRESVEDAVKKGFILYPEATDTVPSIVPDKDLDSITRHLTHLGFSAKQAHEAVTFLTESSPLASNLLGLLSPLETAIEYLILHVPECELPERFLPTNNSSNSFITSAHSGTESMKQRWITEKAIKEAGWPSHIIRECVADEGAAENWDVLLVSLGRRLIGQEASESIVSQRDPFQIDEEEATAFGAHFVDKHELVMPMFSAPVEVHFLLSVDEKNSYPRPGYAPIFITSSTVPAYIRLHLLSELLKALETTDLMGPGQGFCMITMQILEDVWAQIEESRPDISVVFRYIARRPLVNPHQTDFESISVSSDARQARPNRRKRQDHRNDRQIQQDFNKMREGQKYAEILAMQEKLPAFSAKSDFLSMLNTHRAVVVVGETGTYLGCGKTTQLPQFILDSLITEGRGSNASIIVTQPRRISAISVAARVSAERLEDGSVGYAIRGENKQTEKTKLLFCTTGVVLRRLGGGDKLQSVSHIVVDEVHERSIDGDFLLLELREILKSHPTLKVILMSATINHEVFARYFDAPLLSIPGYTHPIVDKYLEDILPLIDYHPPPVKFVKENEATQKAFREEFEARGLDKSTINDLRNLVHSDRIDFQLIVAIIEHITSTSKSVGGILIFLPGVQEIRQCINGLRNVFNTTQADVLPLHANLSSDEQRRVFNKSHKWKIIVATNVAETSITIDDVIYVVDAGKVKETQYDPETNLTRLVETWVTRAAAKQRRGRAGRTQPGVCYRLYTRKQEEGLTHFPVPEILRVPLESISLTVKVMRENEDVKRYLSGAIDPPNIAAMDQAWSVLEELGAVDDAGKLTPLGRHLTMLPVDLRLAKMLVLAAIFQCLGPISTIAACLSSKPLFLNPIDKREEATKARARFSTSGSDLLTDLNAYDQCVQLRAEGKSQSDLRTFCDDNFISSTTVRDVTALKQDFISALSDIGFIPLSSTPSTPALNVNAANTNLLKAIILGGLWPRVARVRRPNQKFDQVQAGTIQRDNTAREFKMYDLREGRVFLHPASVLFDAAKWKSPFLVYFHKHMTSKVFLRDATEVPLYALLFFGTSIDVGHIGGGITIKSKDAMIKLSAWPRIGVLVKQLRRLLDAQLHRCIEEGTVLSPTHENPVLQAMLLLLTNDGLTE